MTNLPDRILVVDDNLAAITLLTQILQRESYQVFSASAGAQALQSVAAQFPDLILLDIDMPGMDGYEVCRRLKANQETSKIPVIFISALDETVDKIKGFGVGAVDYITKPFQAEEVLARVETHLSLWRLSGQLEEQNVQLRQEIAERERVEAELKRHKGRLEELVEERTLELTETNKKLTEEIAIRKVAEQALRESEMELRTLIDAMRDIMLVIDGEGRIVKSTPAYPGRPYKLGDELVGKTVIETFSENNAKTLLKGIRKVLKTHVPVSLEYAQEDRGDEYWFSVALSPLVADQVLWVARNISDLKNTERALRERSVELEEANITLKNLLKNMEEAKKETEDKLALNIRMLVLPYTEKLRKVSATDLQRSYLDELEANLKNVVSPFIHDLRQFNLTPMEIHVARYVREGKTTKDIAELLHTSHEAIHLHRYHLREKLGLNNKKTSLTSFLMSLD